MITKSELLQKIEELENKLLEAEETIDAIKNDKVDALVINTAAGEQVYTLEGAERPYRIFLEQMNEGAITLSLDGIILYCNSKFAELLKVPLEMVIGSAIFRWVSSSDLEKLSSFLLMSNGNSKIEVDFLRIDGVVVSLYLSLKRMTGETSDPVFCMVATDLTEKKRSEEIVAAEKLARSILEQAADAIVVCNDNFQIIRTSKAAEILAGQPVLYRNFDDVFPLTDGSLHPVSLNSLIDTKEKMQVETVLLTKAFEKFNLMMNIGILKGPRNNIIGYVINLTNITKHIEAEAKLSQSLKEKIVLLKEIHHRVKNNLQIISSLLRLQSMNIKEESVLNVLNECQNRITSMALIHQKLYESESYATVNIAAYLRELVTFLSSTYMFSSKNIILNVPAEDNFSFSIDAAVPIGLIINELISNSFKHAFSPGYDGIVSIDFMNILENVFTISVKDNGKGFPENIDFFNPDSLGLQLVHTLTEQVNGKVEMETSGKGTSITVEINLNDLR
jgi:PAS domain S-box-containing protein